MYKKFTLLAMAVLLISIIPTTLKAASEWDNAVTIYGAALENDEDLRSETSGLLEAEDNDETGYVYSEDVDNYLGMLYDNRDRKSTRLNSSHVAISYAVFCLKKKKTNKQNNTNQKQNQQ